MARRSSAEIRAEVGHPIIDADAHCIELTPVLLDYIAEIGGADMAKRYAKTPIKRQYVLAEGDPYNTADSGSWVWPTRNTLDRATASLPSLYAKRLDEFGIDFAIVYPSEGLFAPQLAEAELRQACCRAYNHYISDAYAPHADRMTPAAVIPMHTPQEALDELHYAVGELGFKVVVLRSYVPRPALLGASRERLDLLALGSDYDYDPVWAACRELGVAATFHTSGIYGTRAQVANYSFNHIGVLGQGGESICKALFMGGVTQRFPDLNFAFLEGGVGWALSLYADLISHWERRRAGRIDDYNPASLDLDRFMRLVEIHGDERVLAKLGAVRDIFARRQPDVDAPDNFAAVPMMHPEEFVSLFAEPFFFGCEAEDPVTAHAFNRQTNPYGVVLRAIYGSDNGHWDVADMAAGVADAWDLVERGSITAADFCDFTFTHPAQLHAGMNPKFFAGTRIESDMEDTYA